MTLGERLYTLVIVVEPNCSPRTNFHAIILGLEVVALVMNVDVVIGPIFLRMYN